MSTQTASQTMHIFVGHVAALLTLKAIGLLTLP